MKEFRKRYWYEIALCTTALSLIYSPRAYTIESPAPVSELSASPLGSPEELIAKKEDLPANPKKDVYTINFNNVSIIELIRFTSKISGLNFVFEETDLQFSVTVVSEEPVSAEGMLAALSQVLRVHDLTLLEQGSNVLITKSKKINQIPKIISADLPHSASGTTALVTRVFRIKNANVNTVANILKPMISDTAQIEVSAETKQLIVTDITSNVDQIAALLSSLDAPHASLEVDAYKVKHVAPATLILLAQQILAPFTEGKPLVLVPQVETNSVYIVSTPYLVERVLTLMEDLDAPASKALVGVGSDGPKSSFFVYRPQHCSGEELEQSLHFLSGNLRDAKLADPEFLSLLSSMKWDPITNSLIFTGSPQAIQKMQATLLIFDAAGGPSTSKGFFIYKLQYVNCENLLEQLKHLADKLSSTPQNQQLIAAIEHLECIPSSNSLLISGSATAIEQIKAMAAEFDTKEQAELFSGHAAFFIYKPKYMSPGEIQAALEALTDGEKGFSLNDPKLIQVIHSARYVEQTDSLIFSGPQPTLDKIQQLLTTIDTSASSDRLAEIENVTFLLYKTQFVSGDTLIASLKNFALQLDQSKISDKNVINAINTVRWVKDNNALLFVGNKPTLERIDALIKTFDTASFGKGGMDSIRSASSFVIYDPHYLEGEELISILQNFMQNLQQSGVADASLYDVIGNLKWIAKTSSLLISGDPKAIEQVQQLLARFDVPGDNASSATIEAIDNTSFLVYKLQYHPGNDIQVALKQVAASLDKTAFPHELIETINSLQWIQMTNSILCTGHQDVLVRLKDLIQNLDTPLRQVFIEVLIIETTLSNQQEFGLSWGGQVKYLNKTVLQTGNFPLAPTSGTTPVYNYQNNLQGISATNPPGNQSIPFNQGFDLGVIGDIIMHKGKSFISLGSLVNAIQEDLDSTIILNPKLIAQDNRQSSIFVGQNIPYAGSLVTNSGQNVTTNSNLEYRDVGVSLTITPLLGEGDIVTLDIVQDLSELASGTNVQDLNQQVSGIRTNHSHMETRVHVPSNHFVALSGMINDAKTHNKTGIPCLGGLPVVGALFSNNQRTAQKGNIIVFVRPQIVTNYQDYKAITEHQEWQYKDSARLPILKEEFDEGIDMVKLPENELSDK